MQTKLQLIRDARLEALPQRIKLSGPAKAMLRWAEIQDYDAVLDVNCQDTGLLRKLIARYQVRACALCRDMSVLAQVRETLPDLEALTDTTGEIPWQDGAFHHIMAYTEVGKLSFPAHYPHAFYRVLREDGIAYIAMPFSAFFGWGGKSRFFYNIKHHPLLFALTMAGFTNVSWRFSGLHGVTVIAKKSGSTAF